MRRDVLQSNAITVVPGKTYDQLYLVTTNSFFGMPKAGVVYYVFKTENRLVRLEYAPDLNISLPLSEENLYRVGFEAVMDHITRFKVFKGKKKNLLLFLEQEKETPLLWEFPTVVGKTE